MMMLKKMVIFTLSAGFLIGIGTAFANMPKSSGFYTEGNLGYGHIRETASGSTKEERDGFAANVNGGYKFNPNIAAEIGFARYPNEDFGTAEGEENYALIFAGKGIIPFNNGFEMFAKLGIAGVHHYFKGKNGRKYSDEGSHTEMAGFLGAGIGYVFTPNWEGTIQASTTTSSGHIPAMQMITIGGTYIF